MSRHARRRGKVGRRDNNEVIGATMKLETFGLGGDGDDDDTELTVDDRRPLEWRSNLCKPAFFLQVPGPSRQNRPR